MASLSPPREASAPPPDPGGPGGVRAFRPEDIPAVVALRRQMFQRSAQRSVEDLTRYLRRVFLEHPWRDVDLPSLVHVDPAGEVNGFVGIVPRRLRFQGRDLRVAVPTQLMVRPGSAPGSGLRLAHAVFNGPQDLTFSDAANEAARKLWLRVGGTLAIVPSLEWTLPLHPARYASAHLPLIARTLLRPYCLVRDQLALRRMPRAPAGSIDALDPTGDLPILRAVLGAWPVHPHYDPVGLAWQMQELARREDQGPLIARLVRDGSGTAIGWYLFFLNQGGIGEVVQLGARPGEAPRILEPLIREARALGVIALRGRLEHALVAPLAERGLTFSRGGPWCLTAARDPALLAAVLDGGAFLSRLEGEWWLNF